MSPVLTAFLSSRGSSALSDFRRSLCPVFPPRAIFALTILVIISSVTCARPVTSAVSPHISISPTTGALGVTSFTETYSGFTHNGTITETAIYPNGGPTVFHINADANGNASAIFTLTSQSGNYSSSAVDDATGIHSNTITYTVTAAAPVITGLSPSSYPASGSSQTLTLNGSNFQTSATLTFHDPQGNAYPGRATTFISSSQLSHPFNNGNDPGTWTVFVVNPDGQTSNTWSFTVTTTAPVITGLSPSSYPASGNSQTLTVNGSSFLSGATLTFHDPQGNAYPGRATTFISSSQLSHPFNNGNDPGTWTVFVVNPNGQTSNTWSFSVTSAVSPHISISPTTGALGVTSFTETYSGFTHNGTITETAIYPNGGPTVFHINADANGNASAIFTLTSQSGNYSSSAVDDATGIHSNTITYTVTAAAPVITGLSPSSYPASGSSQTLTVNGSNFQTSATLTFHDPQGNAYPGRATTFISSSQLSHPFNNGNDPGTWTVFVVNPDGQTSNTWSFTVTTTAPVITGLSPSSYPASGNSQTLTVNGSSFLSGATLTFHDPQGNAYPGRATTFISSSQLSHPFNNGNDPGTWTVFVVNPNGQTSNTWSFSVTSAVSPHLSILPTTGTLGVTSFTESYSGFTHSGTITENVTYPNGGLTVYHVTADSNGNASVPFVLTSQSGNYSSYAIDDATGIHSNTITYTLTAGGPTINNVSPISYPPLNSNQTMTINGTNFQSGATLTFFPPEGGTIASTASKLTFVSSSQISYQFNNANDVGTWAVRVNNPNAQSSNTVNFTVTATSAAPSIAVTPSSGPQLTTNFVTSGGGFSPNGQIRQFLTFPGQSVPQEISQITANSQGGFSYTYTTKCSDSIGIYSLYMIDVKTIAQSNSITETVTASGSCSAPTISVSPQSAAQGTSFQITGSGFTHGGQVRRFTVFPNGVTYELQGTTANSLGQISMTVPTDCGSATGSYTTYMLDVGSNAQSTRASDQVTANATCSSNTSLAVDPGSGPLGTQFRFTGRGFKQSSTVTLTVTKPDGTAGGAAQYNTDSSGNVSFIITSLSTDSAGQWVFLVRDNAGNQASTAALYTSSPQTGTDALNFISDVTIQDNSQITAGSTFTKTWRLQNSGTTTWSNYTAVFISNPNNGNPSSNLNNTGATSVPVSPASPNQTIDLSIPMTAPANPGTYYSYWQLQTTSGSRFGVQFYVKIRVVPKQGNTLGFGTQSGRGGTNDSIQAKSGRNADPVNTATGNYNYASTDLRVPGRGLDFELSRSYNSQDVTPGPLGIGWSHSFNIYLTNVTSVGASVHYSDGKVLNYVNQTGTNNFTSSYPGYYDTLIHSGDGTWTLRKTDQRSYQFDSSGKLTSIQDRNSNQISLSYGGGNLSQITDTVGRNFTFNYSGSLLTGITDPSGRSLQFSYDANANLVTFRDANGNANSYTYDGSNHLVKIVDGRGNNLVANTYDVNSRVATQTNGRGNQWTFTYNNDGSTSVFDPLNKETKYLQDTNFNLQQTLDRNTSTSNLLYDDRNNRAQASDQNGNYSAYVYDQNGNITSRTDPALNSRQAAYDAKNNPTQTTDEIGHETQMVYDANGNLTTLMDALSNSSSTTYDSFGEPLIVTDTNGNITTRNYDSQANLISIKDAVNNTTTYAYDSIGRRTSVTDARGKTTRFTYDANDNLLTVTDPLNNVTTYTYDANNNRTSGRDARGNTTTYTYDEDNSLTKETDPKGNFTQYAYDKLDRRISTRDKRGNVTNFIYDNEGRLLTVTDPLGNGMNYAYDANGNRTKITDAKGQSTIFTYDALNRVTKIQDALANTIQKAYDPAGHLMKETDPRGNATQFAYDAIGNLTQVTDAAAGTAKYSYDKNRNRITQTDPNNGTSNLAYDKLNRLLSTTDPLAHSSSYTYDEAGNRISQTDAKGQTTRYTYDSDNRLAVITYPDNSNIQLTRDANGNVTRMVDSLGTSTYVYDELNRLTSYTDPFGKAIGYQYDENGNITKLTYPDGKQVNYLFDANNRMSSLTDWAGKTTTFQYDSTNLLTQVMYPNGIVTSMTYDIEGRLTAKSDSGISSYTFTLDKNGNRTGANVTQPVGNRLQNTSQNYTYDAANRIQNAGPNTFGFDNNGNMISKTEGGVTTNYGYDFENRLVSVSGSSQYFYSGQGVRLQKIEGTRTTRYVVDSNHDLSQVLCETDANGVVFAYYVYGVGLAYKVNPDGTHYYYSFDPLGSTIAMTDDAKKVVNSYAYDPFGKVTNSVEGTANPFQFVGESGVIEDAQGLLYMRARYYDAQTGRFLVRDRAGSAASDSQTLNSFLYSGNNPISRIDPKGLWWKDALQFTGYFLEALPQAAACVAGIDSACNHNQSTTMNVVQGVGQVSFDFLVGFASGGTSELAKAVQAASDALDLVSLVDRYAYLAPAIANGSLTEDEARAAISSAVSDAIDKALPTEFKLVPFLSKEVNRYLTPIVVDQVLRALKSKVRVNSAGSIQITSIQRGPVNPVGRATKRNN